MGYSKATADRMIEVEKLRRGKAAVVTSTSLARLEAPRLEAPTYAKVKREHIAIETLKYFDIPWEYDRVSLTLSPDSNSNSNSNTIAMLTTRAERQEIHHHPPRNDGSGN